MVMPSIVSFRSITIVFCALKIECHAIFTATVITVYKQLYTNQTSSRWKKVKKSKTFYCHS